MTFSSQPVALPHVKQGRLNALAVTSAKRSTIANEIPTVAEAGVPGYEHMLWNAVFVPGATPRDVIAKYDAELSKAVASPDLRERFVALGVEPAARNAAQMAAYLKSEIDKYGKIVRAIGLKIE